MGKETGGRVLCATISSGSLPLMPKFTATLGARLNYEKELLFKQAVKTLESSISSPWEIINHLGSRNRKAK